MLPRIPWRDLPEPVRDKVASQLGGPYTAADATGGAGSRVAAILDTGRECVFVKGVCGGDTEVEDLDMEERVSADLPPCAPRILWRTRADGWDLLASEYVDGDIAEYAFDSPHLSLVVDVLTRTGETRASDARLYSAWYRWGYWCEPGDIGYFGGDRLQHTDPAATNVLVGDRAWLIDWSWATRGPAWIDPALWAVRLISDGDHTLAQAWETACRIPAFQDAPPRGLAALANAEATRWEETLAEGVPNITEVTKAARAWADYVK